MVASLNTDINEGHAWVIDGGKAYCFVTDGVPSGFRYYMHCNWGWNGECDGYYSSSFSIPAGPHSTDMNDNNVYRPYIFSLWQEMSIIGNY